MYSLTVHGMPHARLLWWNALLWRHYAAHSCHRWSSCMSLTRSGDKTLVTRQLSFHLLLLTGTTQKANIQAKHTLAHSLQYKDIRSQKRSGWVPMLACPDFTLRIFKFRIILQHNHKTKRTKSRIYNLMFHPLAAYSANTYIYDKRHCTSPSSLYQ